jgi:hypothetical protein
VLQRELVERECPSDHAKKESVVAKALPEDCESLTRLRTVAEDCNVVTAPTKFSGDRLNHTFNPGYSVRRKAMAYEKYLHYFFLDPVLA